MELRGLNIIGWSAESGDGAPFRAFDPAAQAELDGQFRGATLAQLEAACALAESAARPFADTLPAARAQFLDLVADRLMAGEAEIVPRAMAESGLPQARLSGELSRTANQLRMFASVLREGAWLDLRIDEALPDRAPPRPDIRMMNRPLGPVAVFGASNFPLAFSTAGGDTASALAAGCPVIVKAHPAHPGTSDLVARIVQAAARDSGMPEGVFAHLFDSGTDIGQALVADRRIKAVGFTGSRAGGLALCAVAQGRPEPIPVYAEMSSVNPVVLLPGALAERGAEIGKSFAQAQTLGAGQFCTNPGLVLAMESAGLDEFVAGVREGYSALAAGTMLTAGIHRAYCSGVESFSSNSKVETLAQGEAVTGLVSQPVLFGTSAQEFIADPSLASEVFGAASILVTCAGPDDMRAVLDCLEGQLTAAVHYAASDHALAASLLPRLEELSGRVLFDGFGTGVEVCSAMVHGGPYPATSDARTTSVGSLAIGRFVRPVCYQNVPQNLLPALLRNQAMATMPHRRNGTLVCPS